jgi:hypothetical protein
MNERTPSDHEQGGSQEPPLSLPAARRVSASRRQFAKAGAATPVVLGSLLSKPALATQPYNCTVSGKISGNTSPRPGKVDCKTIGKSPGYWKNATSWPAGALKGVMPYDIRRLLGWRSDTGRRVPLQERILQLRRLRLPRLCLRNLHGQGDAVAGAEHPRRPE